MHSRDLCISSCALFSSLSVGGFAGGGQRVDQFVGGVIEGLAGRGERLDQPLDVTLVEPGDEFTATFTLAFDT